MDPERTPVVVAAGQLVDHDRELGALELATRAAELALSASPKLAGVVDRVSAVNILARSGGPSPAEDVADELRLQPRCCETSTVGGNAPQWLVQRAAADVAAGRLGACLVTGGEAVRSGRLRPPQDDRPLAADRGPERPPAQLVGDDRPGSSAEELAAGISIPAVVYPLVESVLAARAGRAPAEQRAFLGELLAPFTAVAAKHPHAWFPQERSAPDIATPSPENRLVAEPYTKRMTAFLGGSHGAALVVTSLRVARSVGLDDGAMFVRSSATAADVWFPSARPDLGASPAITAAGLAALEAGGVGLDELGFLDLYSCFPSAVQIGAAALGIPLDDPRGLTVTGGLPYFGGPGSNYSTHAIATVLELLRAHGGHALVTALGWYLTKHAVGCYSATPPPAGFQVGDTAEQQQRIDASALPVVSEGELLEGAPAVVEGGTVVYGREGEVIAAPVVATLADGRRAAAAAESEELAGLAGATLVGQRVVVGGRPPRYRVA